MGGDSAGGVGLVVIAWAPVWVKLAVAARKILLSRYGFVLRRFQRVDLLLVERAGDDFSYFLLRRILPESDLPSASGQVFNPLVELAIHHGSGLWSGERFQRLLTPSLRRNRSHHEPSLVRLPLGQVQLRAADS